MWSIDFGHPLLVWLAPVGAAVALIGVWLGTYLSHRAAQKFWRAAGDWPVRSFVVGRALLAAGGVALLLFATALPRWGYEVGVVVRSGRDVVLVVDVSRSMLAEDVSPSRLERSRTDLLDVVDAAQERGGCRIGLVAFAGDGRKLSPLTESFGYVRRQIERLDPSMAARGGSYIESGLRKALELFDARTESYRDIILVSDGDDFGSDLAGVVKELKRKGVVVHAILRGDDRRGAEIPVQTSRGTKRYLRYHGEIVRTVANGEPLRRISQATGGVFVAARTAPLDAAQFFEVAVWQRPKKRRAEELHQKPTERFVWFLAPALLLLVAETMMGFPGSPGHGWRSPARGLAVVAVALGSLVLLTGLGAGPSGQDVPRRRDRAEAKRFLRRALDAYRSGNHEQARTLLQLAVNEDPTWWLSLYEVGALLAEHRLWGEAAHRFLDARRYAPLAVHPLINYSAGTATFRQAEEALVAGERSSAVGLLERADALLSDALAQLRAAPEQTESALKDVLDGVRERPATVSEFERRIRWNLEMTRRLLAKLREQPRQSAAGQEQEERAKRRDGDERRDRSGGQQRREDESGGQRQQGDENRQQGQEQERSEQPNLRQHSSPRTERPQPDGQRSEEENRRQGERLEELEGQPAPTFPQGRREQSDQPSDALHRLRAEMQRLLERDRARLQRRFRVYVPRAEKDW